MWDKVKKVERRLVPEFDATKGGRLLLMVGGEGESGNFSFDRPKACIVVVRANFGQKGEAFPRAGRSVVWYAGSDNGVWVVADNHLLSDLTRTHKEKYFNGSYTKIMDLISQGQIPAPNLFPAALR